MQVWLYFFQYCIISEFLAVALWSCSSVLQGVVSEVVELKGASSK